MGASLDWFDGLADYSIALSVVTVLLGALLAQTISTRLFNHHLAQAITSERRTGITFLRNAVKGTIIFSALLGVVYTIPPLRSVAVGVFAGASILAAIVGFASQHAFANIVSGFFIVLFKPFRVGDIIKIRGEIGTIEDITLRHTVINALENKRLIYPNSVIDSEPIINWTIRDERAQKFMFISIDYAADIDRATEIIREEVLAHPSLLDVRSPADIEAGTPIEVATPVLGLDESMVNFRIPVWAKDLPTGMRMTWDLHRSIKKRFDAEGIALGRPTQVNYDARDVRGAQARG